MAVDEMTDRVKIRTSRGEIEIDTKDVIHFPEGLFGFESYRDFVIFDLKECHPFKSMLSVRDGGPDFVVLEPLEVFEDYAPYVIGIPEEHPELGESYDLVLLSIVTLAERPEDITVNLRGPIFLNRQTRRAKQVILADERCRTKVPLLVSC